MDVHGMQFAGSIDDSPMLKRPDLCSHHRSGVMREFFSIDVETLLVFRECHDESRRRLFFSSEIQILRSGLRELSRTFSVDLAAGRGTMSANTIAGFGSPSGP